MNLSLKFIKYILFVMAVFIMLNSNAQSEVNISSGNNNVRYDTSRIEDLSHKLSLYSFGIERKNIINMAHLTDGKTAENLTLIPNGNFNFGIGFNYKWLGLGIAFRPPFVSKNDNIYGETKAMGFQLNIFTRTFGIDATSQYYKGYYVANPGDFINWDGGAYPSIPDLETVIDELSVYYFINNKKFSYRAVFVRNEIQKKSAGSLILGTYALYNILNSPSGIIPVSFPDDVKKIYNIKSYKSGNVGISVGYTYTLVFLKRFFINLSIIPGFGLKKHIISNDNQVYNTDLGFSFRYVGRMGLGYEGKHFFLGLTSISISNSFKNEDMIISNSTTKFRFFVGKRFNVKKKK